MKPFIDHLASIRAQWNLLMGVLLVAATLCLTGCENEPEGQDIDFELESILINNSNGSRGIAAAIIYPDGTIWQTATGFSDRGNLIELSPDMQFCIASITKTFIAALVLDLESSGHLRLTDPISEYLEPMTNIPMDVSITKLLKHTSGVYNYTDNPNVFNEAILNRSKNWLPKEMIEEFVDIPVFPVGARWEYSNTNYTLLGMVIEQVTGKKLGNVLRETFLEPNNLDLIQLPLDERLTGTVAIPWFDVSGTGQVANGMSLSLDSAFMSLRWAPGGIYGTPLQVARWGELLYGGEILQPGQMNKMLQFERLPNIGGWIGYGLGTQQFRTDDGRMMYGHNGGVRGYSAALRYSPSDGISVAVISNDNLPNTHLIARELLVLAGDHYIGK